jgi:hypothetical protein
MVFRPMTTECAATSIMSGKVIIADMIDQRCLLRYVYDTKGVQDCSRNRFPHVVMLHHGFLYGWDIFVKLLNLIPIKNIYESIHEARRGIDIHCSTLRSPTGSHSFVLGAKFSSSWAFRIQSPYSYIQNDSRVSKIRTVEDSGIQYTRFT